MRLLTLFQAFLLYLFQSLTLPVLRVFSLSRILEKKKRKKNVIGTNRNVFEGYIK